MKKPAKIAIIVALVIIGLGLAWFQYTGWDMP